MSLIWGVSVTALSRAAGCWLFKLSYFLASILGVKTSGFLGHGPIVPANLLFIDFKHQFSVSGSDTKEKSDTNRNSLSSLLFQETGNEYIL